MAGEQFDLVATNPPFVISPATGERLVYRDSGLPGDRVVEHIVRGLPGILREGGTGQVLANWMIVRDQPWEERLSWIPSTGRRGCDAWVVQREVVDLPTYVELWLKDAGLHGSPEYHQRYDTWLSWFEEQGAEAVGFGWINLRRVSTARPAEGRPHAAAGGVALRRGAAHRPRGDRLLRAHRPAAGPLRRGPRRAPGWSPGPTCARSRTALRGPRTPRRSCSASSAGPGALDRSTPSRRRWSAPATAS